jgi:hypothetical protein
VVTERERGVGGLYSMRAGGLIQLEFGPIFVFGTERRFTTLSDRLSLLPAHLSSKSIGDQSTRKCRHY